MKVLTPKQRMILQFIVKGVEKNLYPPTIREIQDYLGVSSTNGVADHLKALGRKGYLHRDVDRSILHLTDKARQEYGLYFGTPMLKELEKLEGIKEKACMLANNLLSETDEGIDRAVEIAEEILEIHGKKKGSA